MKRNVTTHPRPVSPSADPLYNKYVIIGGLVFFATIFLVAIIFHLMRGYRKQASQQDDTKKRLYGHEEESDDPLTGEYDDDMSDLYTSCHLYVEDLEVNTASSDFEYDSRSVDGNVRDDAVVQTNLPSENIDIQTEALERSRVLLTRHFKM